MTGWLTRGLIATAVGAILAFAVTVRVAHVDIANAGAIIMFAGIGYLLVHLGLLGYERGWLSSPEPERRREPAEPYDRYERDERYRRDDPYARQDRLDRASARYGDPRDDPRSGYADPAGQRPRPARVEYHRAGEQGYGATQRRPDETQVMPAVRDGADEDTTVLRRRQQRPER
jgi:hypothetical protein